MSKKVLLIQGHPDASNRHLGHALAESYAAGAEQSGHLVRQIHVAEIDFPLLCSQHDYENGLVPPSLKPAQADILWAEHLVVFFPLWAGDMPALLKGFFEQTFRPAFTGASASRFGKTSLSGRSARVVVTMAMPALVYRWYFRAHSVKSLERSLLGIVGIAPVHETLIGQAADMNATDAAAWSTKLRRLGGEAQ